MEIICYKDEKKLKAHPQDLRALSKYELIDKGLWLDVLVRHLCFYNNWWFLARSLAEGYVR